MSGGISWLTDPQRDFLAHLTTLTTQRQLKPERSYQRVSEALGELAAAGGGPPARRRQQRLGHHPRPGHRACRP